ncbi:MAG: RDD family protein [Defluviitaleaceae bacterium]|nr:RDD family protein [Defluviitaleaceae bacterium]
MFFRRVLANFVDIFIFVAITVAMFVWVLPFFVPIPEGEYMSLAWAALALVGVAGFTLVVQWPFYLNNQTVGKAFFRLRLKSTNDTRPLTAIIILQREIFAKIFTMYFMCFPVLWGSQGYHDVACETEVEVY